MKRRRRARAPVPPRGARFIEVVRTKYPHRPTQARVHLEGPGSRRTLFEGPVQSPRMRALMKAAKGAPRVTVSARMVRDPLRRGDTRTTYRYVPGIGRVPFVQDMRRRRRMRRDPGEQLHLRFHKPIVDVLGRERQPDKVWPDGSYNCPFCWAAVPAGARGCPNPACTANPHYPVERARREVAAAEERKREEAQRERDRAWREQYQEQERIDRERARNTVLEKARQKGACLKCSELGPYRPVKLVKHRGKCPKERHDPQRSRPMRNPGRKGVLHGAERLWIVLEPVRMLGGRVKWTMHSRVASYARAKAIADRIGGKVKPA